MSMGPLVISRPTIIWLVLLAATALSWALGHAYGVPGMRYAGVYIIVIAFLKVRLVILEFMEIRHAPLPMRLAAEAWVITLCAILTTLFVRAPH